MFVEGVSSESKQVILPIVSESCVEAFGYVFSNRMAKTEGMNRTPSRAVRRSVLGSREFGSVVQLTGMGW